MNQNVAYTSTNKTISQTNANKQLPFTVSRISRPISRPTKSVRIDDKNSIKKERELRNREYKLFEKQNNIKKITWEQQKPIFINDYTVFKNRIEENDLKTLFPENLESLLIDLTNLIERYDKNVYQATGDEQHMRQYLINLRTTIITFQRWHERRIQTNLEMESILNKGKNYSINEIEYIIKSLNMCYYKYTEYKDFLNSSEQIYFIKIPELLKNADQQLRNSKIEMQREIEQIETKCTEQKIQISLNKAYQEVHEGNLIRAVILLRTILTETKNISNWDYVSQELRTKLNNLNVSIQRLDEEIKAFKERQKINSLKIANTIIYNALNRSSYTDKTLLERHYERLQSSISSDLSHNWFKFDQNIIIWTPIFDQISECITHELIPTTFFQRYSPTNWTNAALCLNRSKLIAPEITAMIESWVSTSSTYLELPVFTNTESINIVNFS